MTATEEEPEAKETIEAVAETENSEANVLKKKKTTKTTKKKTTKTKATKTTKKKTTKATKKKTTKTKKKDA